MTRAVIIGGGLAGAGVAARLAALRRPALVLEREAGAHDKICGEFLSVEAGRHLAALGFDTGRLGGARIDTMRLHVGRRTAQARLPFVATGVTRRALDAALLDHAEKLGAEVRRGVAVRGLSGGRAVTATGEIDGDAVVLATGKHELRGLARDPKGTIDDLIGFKMFFRTTPKLRAALAGAVTVTAYDGGYAGLQCVENDRINLCLLVERGRFKALGGRWEALFAALLHEPGLQLLGDAEAMLAKPLTISGVPYGFLFGARRVAPRTEREKSSQLPGKSAEIDADAWAFRGENRGNRGKIPALSGGNPAQNDAESEGNQWEIAGNPVGNGRETSVAEWQSGGVEAANAWPADGLAAEPALWRVGDQAAVIPSFCGDGMAMALHGARLAADLLDAGALAARFQARLHADVARQVRLATTVQRLANGRAGRFALINGLAAVPAALGLLARWTRVAPEAVEKAGA